MCSNYILAHCLPSVSAFPYPWGKRWSLHCHRTSQICAFGSRWSLPLKNLVSRSFWPAYLQGLFQLGEHHLLFSLLASPMASHRSFSFRFRIYLTSVLADLWGRLLGFWWLWEWLLSSAVFPSLSLHTSEECALLPTVPSNLLSSFPNTICCLPSVSPDCLISFASLPLHSGTFPYTNLLWAQSFPWLTLTVPAVLIKQNSLPWKFFWGVSPISSTVSRRVPETLCRPESCLSKQGTHIHFFTISNHLSLL